MQKTIKTALLSELVILALWFYSFTFFINFQIAFLSSLLILLGSTYSYKRLVDRRVASQERPDDVDVIEKIDDPFDLYSDEITQEQGTRDETVDIKALVKEEKKRIKVQNVKNTAKSAPALLSMFRVIPYLFLILGFIALKNNALLSLMPYLIGLGFGILAGLYMGRSLFVENR
ncbi:hypothetical protein [Sulfurimonas sp. HSL3-7]|uniref:hypothetical protein n=1 Tax=Sulfonitrofixus jiaomeiensis TaxID=3131938 RepID=UPI0031F8BDE1